MSTFNSENAEQNQVDIEPIPTCLTETSSAFPTASTTGINTCFGNTNAAVIDEADTVIDAIQSGCYVLTSAPSFSEAHLGGLTEPEAKATTKMKGTVIANLLPILSLSLAINASLIETNQHSSSDLQRQIDDLPSPTLSPSSSSSSSSQSQSHSSTIVNLTHAHHRTDTGTDLHRRCVSMYGDNFSSRGREIGIRSVTSVNASPTSNARVISDSIPLGIKHGLRRSNPSHCLSTIFRSTCTLTTCTVHSLPSPPSSSFTSSASSCLSASSSPSASTSSSSSFPPFSLSSLPIDPLILCLQFLPYSCLISCLSQLSHCFSHLTFHSSMVHKYSLFKITAFTLSNINWRYVNERIERKKRELVWEGVEADASDRKESGQVKAMGRHEAMAEVELETTIPTRIQLLLNDEKSKAIVAATHPMTTTQIIHLATNRLKWLRGLTFSSSSSKLITDQVLTLLLLPLTRLKLLQLRGLDQVTSSSLFPLLIKLTHLPYQLRALELRLSFLVPHDLELLSHSKLTSLTLGRMIGNNYDQCNLDVCTHISKMSNLTRLQLLHCGGFNQEGLKRIVNGLRQLKELKINRWWSVYRLPSNEKNVDLSPLLTASPTLTRLSFTSCSFIPSDILILSHLSSLQHLTLTVSIPLISSGCVSALSTFSSSLLSLSLPRGIGERLGIGGRTIVTLINGVKKNGLQICSQLEELNLSGIIEEENIREVIQGIRKCKKLKILNLSRNPVLTDEIMRPLMLTDGEQRMEDSETVVVEKRKSEVEIVPAGGAGASSIVAAIEGERVEVGTEEKNCVRSLRMVNVMDCNELSGEFIGQWRLRRSGLRLLHRTTK